MAHLEVHNQNLGNWYQNERTAQSHQAGNQHTEVHNQNLGTGIQPTGTSRTPNEVSLSMPAIRFEVAVHGDNVRKYFPDDVDFWQ